MGRLRRVVLAIPCLFFLSACATSYQTMAHQGGYSETEISKDTYQVVFAGNGITRHITAQSYWLYRCAELTLAKGYSGFEITTPVPLFRNAEEEDAALKRVWVTNAMYVPRISGNIRMSNHGFIPQPPTSFDAAALKNALEPWVKGSKCWESNVCEHPRTYLNP